MIALNAGPTPTTALTLNDCETLDDVVEAVHAVSRGGQAIVIDLHPASTAALRDAGVPLTAVLEAIQDAGAGSGLTITCHVASEAVRQRLAALLKGDASRRSEHNIGSWSVCVRNGDITAIPADAVVNASNTLLRLGSGVSGALARACGPGLQSEMDRLGGLSETGMAVTGAHALRTTSRILHVPTASGDRGVVRHAMDNILQYCAEERLASVAIPALGTGTGGLAAEVFAREALDALRRVETSAPCRVSLVLWSDLDYDAVAQVLGEASDGR